jgi:hypothetical protein
MGILKMKYTLSLVMIFYIFVLRCYAGPPFITDDPQPVPYRHWEFYISSINSYQSHEWSGTAPHLEMNYGFIRNMQVHLLLPLNYAYVPHQTAKFGYADTELGIKYCFLQETATRPQLGTFPIFEVPTVKNDEFSDGYIKIFLPVWVQKSWNKLTSYGGIGYWINQGTGNKNSFFSGGELQYEFSQAVTLGGELYFQSADAVDSKSVVAFNIGGSVNPSEKLHFIFSFGHSLTNERFFSSYLGLLWTI